MINMVFSLRNIMVRLVDFCQVEDLFPLVLAHLGPAHCPVDHPADNTIFVLVS
jgi:hypothetical protein